MTTPWNSVRVFRFCIHLWVFGFVLSALPAAEWLWDYPVSPKLPAATHPLGFFTQAFDTWPWAALLSLPIVLLLCVRNLLRPARWWSSFLVWMLFTSLMNRAWMAASGGQQLISNLLFWLIFIPDGSKPLTGVREVIGVSSFWILRLQLLLAYAATGLHKLTGVHWLDGTAMGIVATDPAYGPAGLAEFPLLAASMTWSVLLFQLTFPVALWFRRTRVPWMVPGILFHLGTAFTLGIPEMAFAFIAAYPIWLSDDEAGRVAGLLQQRRMSVG